MAKVIYITGTLSNGATIPEVMSYVLCANCDKQIKESQALIDLFDNPLCKECANKIGGIK